MDAILKLLNPGDEVISCNDLYGGSYRLMTKVFGKYGIKFSYIDMNTLERLDEVVTDKTKLLWVETPTNPMLNIVDIKAICDYAKNKNILVCVDNTFASPYLQNPIDLGADMVMHSATKYLGGHSDVIHGAVIVNDEEIASQLSYIQNAAGAVPGPMDCFLMLRGIKTLHIRVQRSCENARTIAHFLKDHKMVSKVYYPGFETHPNHDIAKKQMRDFGGMVSFDLHDNSEAAANKVLSGTHLFSLAESLGGVGFNS